MRTELPSNRLRELREARGEKPYDLAAKFRVDQSTIYRWEQVGMPDWAKLALAEHYGVSVSYLLGWDSVEEKVA